MTLAYASKLGLQVLLIDVRVQKIDDLLFKTFKMVITALQILNKHGRAWFFKNLFLLANTSIKVVLEMFFFFLAIQTSNLQKKSLLESFIPPKTIYQLLKG